MWQTLDLPFSHEFCGTFTGYKTILPLLAGGNGTDPVLYQHQPILWISPLWLVEQTKFAGATAHNPLMLSK